jgi:hypothetical protein
MGQARDGGHEALVHGGWKIVCHSERSEESRSAPGGPELKVTYEVGGEGQSEIPRCARNDTSTTPAKFLRFLGQNLYSQLVEPGGKNDWGRFVG